MIPSSRGRVFIRYSMPPAPAPAPVYAYSSIRPIRPIRVVDEQRGMMDDDVITCKAGVIIVGCGEVAHLYVVSVKVPLLWRRAVAALAAVI